MNYSTIIQNHHAHLPCAFVDIEAFDANVEAIAKTVAGTSLTIRVATKSIRVPELISRVLSYGHPFKGLMCYSAQEALYLARNGFDDLLIAYPTLSEKDLSALKEVHEMNRKISLVVDDGRQLEKLNAFFIGSTRPFPVLLEPDLSMKIGSLTIGVRRSPLRSVEQVVTLARSIQNFPALSFQGLMAYEAHVAGVGDRNPFKPLLSPLLHLLRRFAVKKIMRKRSELRKALPEMKLFNGGGTGSLAFNRAEEKVLTELTAGSGFFCPHLFDYYSNLQLRPAAFFALQVVRQPEPHWFTCQGGGYVASGEPGWDRVPKLHDSSMKLSGFEATGEVQTPVESARSLELGSPVIFRHAKAGELAERFNSFHLLENGKLGKEVPTYRGLGLNFF